MNQEDQHTPTPSIEKTAPLQPYISKIENPTIRCAVLKHLDETPDYYWSIPASSSGKYHPAYTLGPGGLVRHTIAACRLYLDLLETLNPPLLKGAPALPHLRDHGLAALIVHDTWKSGFHSGQTTFEHPLIAAAHFTHAALSIGLSPENTREISDAITRHMGKWNTSRHSSAKLPIPTTLLQHLVHTADYLASRPHITVTLA